MDSSSRESVEDVARAKMPSNDAIAARGGEAARSASTALLLAIALGGLVLVGIGVLLGKQIGRTVTTLVAEESSSAASELSGQSEELAAMVGSSRLDSHAASGRGLRAPAIRPTAAPAVAPAHVVEPFPMGDAEAVRDF